MMWVDTNGVGTVLHELLHSSPDLRYSLAPFDSLRHCNELRLAGRQCNCIGGHSAQLCPAQMCDQVMTAGTEGRTAQGLS